MRFSSSSTTVALLICLTLHLHSAQNTNAQSCTTGETTCEKGVTYCSSTGVCEPLSYAPLVKTKQKPATKGKKAFHVIIFSDVQWYFLNCKEAPLSECIYTGFTGPRPQRRDLLDAAAARMGSCVTQLSTQLKDVKMAINNGDITNRGLPDEVNVMETFHKQLQANMSSKPLLMTLGNHDYFLGDEDASVRSISYFETAIKAFASRTKLRNIDYDSTDVVYNAFTKRNEKYSRGSMAYSVEYNKYVFIILNWAVALRSGEYTAQFEAVDERNGNATHFIDVTAVTQWLKDELANSKKKKRKVVLVPHAWKGLRLYTQRVSGMSDVLYDSSVIAVLSSHVHDAYGFDNDWEIGSGTSTRTIPLFYSGSASYNKLIAVKMRARKKGLRVKVYDTKTVPCVKTSSTSTSTD